MAPAASQPYPSDLSDQEWATLAPLLSPPKPGGRPRSVDLRRICNGLFHVLRSGCQWRLTPRKYGPVVHDLRVLARAVGQLPPRVIVYGVEGEDFSMGAQLSPTVRAAVGEVVTRIIADIRMDGTRAE
jgi:hypothetical protein